jgi:hypothetical protein
VRWTGANTDEHYWSAADVADCPPEPGTPGGFAPESAPAPPPSEALAGLAVTTAHYLVVGLPESGAILVFDLHTGGTPQRFALPPVDGAATIPWDMAPLADGGVAILDRVNRALWILDSTFRPVPLPDPLTPVELLFQPEADDGEAPRARAASETPLPLRLTDSVDPVSVEALEDGSFLILDLAAADVSTVRRYAPGTSGALASVTLEDGDEYRIPAHDFAYLRSRRVTVDCATTEYPPVLFVTHPHRQSAGRPAVRGRRRPLRLLRSGRALAAGRGTAALPLHDQRRDRPAADGRPRTGLHLASPVFGRLHPAGDRRRRCRLVSRFRG